MEQRLIGLHRFWPVGNRPAVLSFNQQLLFLRQILRQIKGLLGLLARLADIAQVPQGFGHS